MAKGFTLIELLIYSAIFAIVLIVAIDLFFQSRSLEVQIAQSQEVERNARAVFLGLSQTLRASENVTTPPLGATANELFLNSNTIRYFVDGQGILKKAEGGQAFDITSNSVTVENLSFTTRGEVGEKPTVSISFTIKANTRVWGQPDFISRTYKTTVQLR